MTSDSLLPPHDIGAEEAVNGSLLIDGQTIREIVNTLKVDDFYNEANRNIFAVCKGLYEAGTAIDQVTVAEALNRSDKLEPSGGVAYLSHLIAVVPTSLVTISSNSSSSYPPDRISSIGRPVRPAISRSVRPSTFISPLQKSTGPWV